MNASDMNLIIGLLWSAAIGSLIFGFILGWSIRGMNERRAFFKRGIYCDDCAPVASHEKSE